MEIAVNSITEATVSGTPTGVGALVEMQFKGSMEHHGATLALHFVNIGQAAEAFETVAQELRGIAAADQDGA